MAKRMGIFISSESSDTTEEDEPGPRITMEPIAQLPFLPDDCLLAIMKYLGPVDLNRLSSISDRLKVLAADKSLWKRIDFRPYKLTSSQLTEYLKYFNPTTTFVAIRGFVSGSSGNQWRRKVITPRLLNEISSRCPALETLILEAIAFEFSLMNFPASLRHLSLKRSIVTHIDTRRSYFQGMHDIFPNLKVLILSNCRWVSSHDFMAISKCSLLEELRMDGCPQLGECVAYTSLAARFGFPSLKILDLRNTRMGDSDVSCFSHTLTLTELYLQSPPSDSEDSDDRWGEPSGMDSPHNDDFTESTDDDNDDDDADDDDDDEEEEEEVSSVKSSSSVSSQVWFPQPIFHLPSALPSQWRSKNSHDSGRDHTSSRLRKDKNRRRENGNIDLPQASTSHGKLCINPGGPSAVKIGQKRSRPRKRPSHDSGSSSDDSSSTPSKLNVINTGTSDTETVDSGSLSIGGLLSSEKKLVHSKKTGRTSTKPKRQCNKADSVRSNKNKVPMPNAADSSRFAVAGCSTSEQQVADLPPPTPVIIISSAPTSGSEENSESDSDPVRRYENIPFHNPISDWSNRSANNGDFNSPFHHANIEPSNESTITDTCIMSYVLDDMEADRVGYVRIVAPQSLNARSQLHTLVVRNYRMITDAALQYLLRLPSLRYLDVSGTSVTEGGVLQFKLKRPDVYVVCDFKDLPI